MDMDLKIVLTLVLGNGVVLSVFYYAFTSKIKEIARNEAKETKEEFDIFENKIETRLLAMDMRINANQEKISLINQEVASIKQSTDAFSARIEKALFTIHERIDKILEKLADK
jgi:SMC interacting uncharacterized protein involved in chromosome segregation